VNRVRLLCALNAHMMGAFSQRTADGLKDYTLFRLLLPAFQSFLDINVRKEVEKDRRVIASAAAARKAGRAPDRTDTERLLKEARAIDAAFLRQAALFPIAIDIPYRDIEPTRQRRIELLLEAAWRLFGQWEQTPRFRAAVAGLYAPEQFRALLHEILHLYGRETQMLSHSVHLPYVLTLARDSLTQAVYTVMESAAEELARTLTAKVYRRGG